MNRTERKDRKYWYNIIYNYGTTQYKPFNEVDTELPFPRSEKSRRTIAKNEYQRYQKAQSRGGKSNEQNIIGG